MLDVSVGFQDFRIARDSSADKLSEPMGNIRFDNAFRLPWDIWLNACLSVRTSGHEENVYVKNCTTVDLGISKSFFHDRWSARFQCTDIGAKWRHPMRIYDAVSVTVIKKKLDTRDLFLTVCYNFGTPRPHYKGGGAGNGEKPRL